MYKESETLELKREINSNICKEIIAFANTKGGTIYIGYDYARKNGKITRENVEDLFGCSKTSAIRKLNSYVEKEILKKVDVGKNTYYEIYNK